MQEIMWRYYPQVAKHPLARAFIESLAKRQKRPKTVDAYARNLEDLIGAFSRLGMKDLVEAKTEQIETYIDDLFMRPPAGRRKDITSLKGRGLSPNTIQQRLVTARLFYDFCIAREYRKNQLNPLPRGNPGFADTPAERGIVSHQERLPWIPSDAEWENLITYLVSKESSRNQAMILIAYDGALRREELVSLRLDDFDWPAQLVKIRPETTKSGRQRSVTFSRTTGTILKGYLWNDRAHILAAFGGDKNGPLFLSESNRNAGQPILLGTVNDVIERIRRDVALPRLTTHTFRHLRCTVLKRCGVDLKDIALYAGHESVATTEIYIHLAPSELSKRIRQAMAAFDSRMEQLIGEAIRNA
jgi:site-specific recombinase XerD